MHRVVIDSLHLFLHISDVLFNLLIHDLRIHVGVEKSSDKMKVVNFNTFESFLTMTAKLDSTFMMTKTVKHLNGET